MHRFAVRSALMLDISRLIWRARRHGPTGIDRVELAYAQHFIDGQQPRPAFAVVHLLGFVFALRTAAARRLIAELDRRWSGELRLTGWGNLRSLARIYCKLVTVGWLWGPWLRRALRARPGPPIFLVVSHHHVQRGSTIRRVRRTLGARTACLIHDLLPLEYPEYFLAGWELRYRELSRTVGRLFDAALVPSESTAQALRSCLRADSARGRGAIVIRTSALGARPFPQTRLAPTPADARPHFVVLGTIEPRKNHLLLLNLWARIASVAHAPRLFVVGSRGWENEQIIDMLERSRRLRGLVEECSGLSDAEVGALVHSARALLQPSFAEGFGLPLAEGLASGVPVICSDIAPFRELGRDVPEYLDPHDINAWTEAVLDYCRPDSTRRAAQLERLSRWRAPSWTQHFEAVEGLLREVETGVYTAPAEEVPQLVEVGS
jgi:glycosyltransferase involved in cell wall biosynthesis